VVSGLGSEAQLRALRGETQLTGDVALQAEQAASRDLPGVDLVRGGPPSAETVYQKVSQRSPSYVLNLSCRPELSDPLRRRGRLEAHDRFDLGQWDLQLAQRSAATKRACSS